MRIRCKWYDDNGQPIAGGCKSQPCTFAHPDDSGWSSAERRQMARGSDPNSKWKSMERPPTPPSLSHRKAELRKGSGSFSHTEKKPDFDEDSWGAEPFKTSTAASSSVSWRRPAQASTSGGWGKPPSTSGWGENPVRSGGSGWNAGSGWGASSEETSGWGESSGRSAGSGWGASTEDTGGWDVPILKTWSTQPADLEKKKITRNTSFSLTNPRTDRKIAPLPRSRTASIELSAPKTRDPRTSSFTSESKGKQREPSRPDPDLSMDTQLIRARSIQLALASRHGSAPSAIHIAPSFLAPTTPMAPPPLPASATRPKMALPPRSASSTSTEPRELLVEAKALKRSESQKEELKAKISIMQAGLSREERMDVYQKVIKHTQSLVDLQIRLNKLKVAEENWRRNQKSPFYAQSSNRAREKLEAGRKVAHERVVELQKQRDITLAELITLPDIPTRSHRPYNVNLDRQKLMDYTLELKSWLEALDMPRRLSVLHHPSLEGGDTSDSMGRDGPSKDGSDRPRVVPTLRERNPITVEDVTLAIETLQQRTAGAEESTYFHIYTIPNIDDATREFREGIKKKRKQKVCEAMDVQKQQLEKADKMIREKADETIVIQNKINSLEATLVDLKGKTTAINEVNEKSEILIHEAELKQKERTQLIEELSTQLRTVILNRRSRSIPRPVRDITVEDIAPELRQALVDRLKIELQPVLEGFVEGTRVAGERVKATVKQMVEPVVKCTAEISGRVEGLSVS